MCKSIAEGGGALLVPPQSGRTDRRHVVRRGPDRSAAGRAVMPTPACWKKGAGAPEPSREDADGFLTKEVPRSPRADADGTEAQVHSRPTGRPRSAR